MTPATLLVIEDDAAIRRFVRLALEEQGHRVHEADTLARGLVEAGTRQPDLLILDLGLPDGDGLTLLARVRGLRPGQVVRPEHDLPMLIMTARDAVLFMLAWEIMSLAPFFLIDFNDGDSKVRDASWVYLVAAHLGAVALIAMRYLPETLAPASRSQASLAVTMKDYVALAMDGRLLRYALAGGFYYGGCYAFIAGTPFAYVDYYQVSAQAYGLLFGANILGLMVLNFVNTRLVAKWGPERLFRYGAWAAAASALWLALDAWWGLGGVAGLAVPIFCYMSVSGFIVANSVDRKSVV